jgi:heme iron utilization protein
MLNEELAVIARLLRTQRQAALGTNAEDGAPFVSMVACAPEPDFSGILLHLSSLSPHTRHLRRDPRAALLLCEPDGPHVADVQTLARLSLSGQVTVIERETAAYHSGRARYLERLPASAMLFDFPDFALFRLIPSEGRYVGGFARAYTLTPEHLARAAHIRDLA